MNFKRLLAVTALLCGSLACYGQSAHPLVQPMWHFVDETGSPCVGCHLYSYLAGTSTPTPTYTDSTGTVQNTNPVVLDVAGQAQIWVGSLNIKLILKHADDSLIWTVDNISTWTNGGGAGCSTSGLSGYFLVTDGSGGCTTTQIQVNGTPLTAPSPLNFIDSSTVHFTNPSLGTVQAVASAPNNFQYQLNDTPLGGKFDPSISNPAILDFNSTLPAPPTGKQNVTWQTDSTTGRISGWVDTAKLAESITPPAAGNYVVLYPSSQDFTTGSSGYCPGWNAANPSGGYGVSFPSYSGLFTGGVCQNTLSTWVYADGTAWPGAINPANVTAVYAVSINGFTAGTYSPLYSGHPFAGTPVLSCASSSVLNTGNLAQQVNALTTLTGATIAASTCTESITQNSSIGTAVTAATLEAPIVALYVYSTDAPAPTNNSLNIGPYLNYNRVTNTLSTAIGFPQFLITSTITNLITAGGPPNAGVAFVLDYDSSTAGTCIGHGGGSIAALAEWSATTNWYCTPIGAGGSGGGTYFTETLSCTGTSCTLAHTPTEFDTLSQNGLILVNGTDYTQSGTSITFTTAPDPGDVIYAQYHY